MKRLLVLLLLVGGIAAFLYFPRDSTPTATDAATLAVLNRSIEGSRSGGTFAPALDGEIFKTGDVVRADVDGRAVLTFFDGSSLSVDPGSHVKVLALSRLAGQGIGVTIEQTLGRSWSAVQKLKTPDSRYEIKTPSTSAVVRGTSFLTLVQTRPTGGTQTTYQVDEGTLTVNANAGGTVNVTAGTQVTIAEGAPAPAAATPIPQTAKLQVTGSPGLGFLVVAPTGAACGPAGPKAEVFGCVVTAETATIRDPAPGRWGLVLTAPNALPGGATITVDTIVGQNRTAQRKISRPYVAGEIVRSGTTLTGGDALAASVLEDPVVVSSVCAATAPGQVFWSGELTSRLDSVRAFTDKNKGAPVSVVYTQDELNKLMTTTTSAAPGVTLNETKITIDASGIHGTARAATQVVTVDARADVVGGAVGEKFALQISRLAADPLPPGLVDLIRGMVNSGTAQVTANIPFQVRQVAFRGGCLWVSGVTAP